MDVTFSWLIHMSVFLIRGNKYQKKNILIMKQLNAQFFVSINWHLQYRIVNIYDG